MTNSFDLHPLYYPHGPLVDDLVKQRLTLLRARLRSFLTLSLSCVMHATVFFAFALLLRSLSVEGVTSDVVLGIFAILICASMAAAIGPALVKQWRSEAPSSNTMGRLESETQESGLNATTVDEPSRVEGRPDGPPLNAAFLFYLFLTPKESDALIGDIEEHYEAMQQKFGVRRANLWFWTQAIRSLGSIVWWATKRAVTGFLGLAAIVKFFSRADS